MSTQIEIQLPDDRQAVQTGHSTRLGHDAAQKISSQREAKASAKVVLGSEVYQMVAGNTIAKGDVLTVRASCNF